MALRIRLSREAYTVARNAGVEMPEPFYPPGAEPKVDRLAFGPFLGPLSEVMDLMRRINRVVGPGSTECEPCEG